MSGPPMVKSMNFAESVSRPVLVPAGNKAKSSELHKSPGFDECNGGNKFPAETLCTPPEKKNPSPVSLRNNVSRASSILRQQRPNLSLHASCSSDASTDSWQSRGSTGRVVNSRRSATPLSPPLRRKQQCSPKSEKLEKMEGNGKSIEGESEGVMTMDGAVVKKRCAWVTSNTDPSYTAFHDEEWGLPVHDDKKLFEMLSFSTALAELTWSVILNKRHIFRDIFLDFNPIAVSKLNENRIATPESPASFLLSESKLRAVIENARQICKIMDELGSFDRYIWGFVNNKPIVGNFRYSRQIPIKTSKADTISKDLVRRGFRGVGPTVIYSFMQVTGITNDHLINCFRYQDCIIVNDLKEKNESLTNENEGKPEDLIELELATNVDYLSLSR